jgi:cyclophilin family peptidyl-prolyl cis-trans isomerase
LANSGFYNGVKFHRVIKDQIKASEDCGGDGFIVWHAANQYGPFFAAYAAYQKEKAARLASGK